MLPKTSRLSRSDFIQVKRHGTVSHYPLFSLVYKKSLLPHNRFSVIVSTRVFSKAVLRNKVRRFTYRLLSVLPPQSADVIVFLKPGASKISYEKISTEINSVIPKILS
jgi:ribonuclease P protein component